MSSAVAAGAVFIGDYLHSHSTPHYFLIFFLEGADGWGKSLGCRHPNFKHGVGWYLNRHGTNSIMSKLFIPISLYHMPPPPFEFTITDRDAAHTKRTGHNPCFRPCVGPNHVRICDRHPRFVLLEHPSDLTSLRLLGFKVAIVVPSQLCQRTVFHLLIWYLFLAQIGPACTRHGYLRVRKQLNDATRTRVFLLSVRVSGWVAIPSWGFCACLEPFCLTQS